MSTRPKLSDPHNWYEFTYHDGLPTSITTGSDGKDNEAWYGWIYFHPTGMLVHARDEMDAYVLVKRWLDAGQPLREHPWSSLWMGWNAREGAS